ncbi:MAG: hypothetical protein LBL66_09325 [Clostridiales bacterium]|jgi:hypothetical protein|nr:hypothetical protein [Clostridiales bacterium]
MTEQEYQARIWELENEIAALKASKISMTQVGLHTPMNNYGEYAPGRAVKLYALTSELAAVAAKEPTDTECTDVAGLFCDKQRAYIKAAKAAEREIAKSKPTLPRGAETPEDAYNAAMEKAERRALGKIRAALKGVPYDENECDESEYDENGENETPPDGGEPATERKE